MTRAVWLTVPAPPLDRVIVEALQAEPTIERIVCVYPSGRAPAPPLRATSPAKLHYAQADFSSYRSLREVLSSRALQDVDTIVHVLQESERVSRDHHVSPSAEGTRALLLLAQEHSSVRRFVLRSFASLYRLDNREPVFIDENHALDLEHVPVSLRACAEADFVACEKFGNSELQTIVLRCAELLTPGGHNPLYDYLSSRVCLRPLGYDPMLNVLSPEDLACALRRAASSTATGVFNIPGYDTLPLSELTAAARRISVPVPGPALSPLYALRRAFTGLRFQYSTDETRFHYGAVLDGSKARQLLGYVPEHSVDFEHLFAGGGS
jgi:UDP-glucose 4-epimerase